jgi:hypothetical protein
MRMADNGQESGPSPVSRQCHWPLPGLSLLTYPLLVEAVVAGHEAVVRALLAAGADID